MDSKIVLKINFLNNKKAVKDTFNSTAVKNGERLLFIDWFSQSQATTVVEGPHLEKEKKGKQNINLSQED